MPERACSPWWRVEGGYFAPFVERGDRTTWPAEAARLAEDIAAEGLPGTVYLRGSVLESPMPFSRSDVDVLVVANGDFTPEHRARLRTKSPRPMDLKVFDRAEIERDPVQRALVVHRSVRVAGPALELAPTRADREHARDLWLAYTPFALPPTVSTSDRWALLHLKGAARAFGVLSFLRDGRLTRDVGACLEWAATEAPEVAARLVRMRSDLESGSAAPHDIRPVRDGLVALFDRCWPGTPLP